MWIGQYLAELGNYNDFKNLWTHLQLKAKQIAPLVYEHYENDVALREQNLTCQPLEMLMYLYDYMIYVLSGL